MAGRTLEDEDRRGRVIAAMSVGAGTSLGRGAGPGCSGDCHRAGASHRFPTHQMRDRRRSLRTGRCSTAVATPGATSERGGQQYWVTFPNLRDQNLVYDVDVIANQIAPACPYECAGRLSRNYIRESGPVAGICYPSSVGVALSLSQLAKGEHLAMANPRRL